MRHLGRKEGRQQKHLKTELGKKNIPLDYVVDRIKTLNLFAIEL